MLSDGTFNCNWRLKSGPQSSLKTKSQTKSDLAAWQFKTVGRSQQWNLKRAKSCRMSKLILIIHPGNIIWSKTPSIIYQGLWWVKMTVKNPVVLEQASISYSNWAGIRFRSRELTQRLTTLKISWHTRLWTRPSKKRNTRVLNHRSYSLEERAWRYHSKTNLWNAPLPSMPKQASVKDPQYLLETPGLDYQCQRTATWIVKQSYFLLSRGSKCSTVLAF